jgi:hypothetical protein
VWQAVLIAASTFPISFGHAGPYSPGPDEEAIPQKLKPFANFIADVSDRSRRVIYTPYPVSAELGVVRGFVHVSDGTAVLARTDLVVDASLPIVFRRAYHSRRARRRVTSG